MMIESLAMIHPMDADDFVRVAELVICPGCAQPSMVTNRAWWELLHHDACSVRVRRWGSHLWAMPFFTSHVLAEQTVEVSRGAEYRLSLHSLLIPAVLDYGIGQIKVGRMCLLAGPSTVPSAIFNEEAPQHAGMGTVQVEPTQVITFQVTNYAKRTAPFAAVVLVEIR